MLKEFCEAFLYALLERNGVLYLLLGLCPVICAPKKPGRAARLGFTVGVTAFLSAIILFPIQRFILTPTGFGYLRLPVFVAAILAISRIVGILFKRDLKGESGAPAAANCAVLGIVLICTDANFTFLRCVASSLGASVGFLLATMLLTAARMRIDDSALPDAVKGLPASLMAASIVSLSMFGFSGVAGGIFG